jgi:hypothetical protein
MILANSITLALQAFIVTMKLKYRRSQVPENHDDTKARRTGV